MLNPLIILRGWEEVELAWLSSTSTQLRTQHTLTPPRFAQCSDCRNHFYLEKFLCLEHSEIYFYPAFKLSPGGSVASCVI